jgi:hypothetical protein
MSAVDDHFTLISGEVRPDVLDVLPGLPSSQFISSNNDFVMLLANNAAAIDNDGFGGVDIVGNESVQVVVVGIHRRPV